MGKQLIERIAPLVQAAIEQDYLFPAQGGRKSLSEAITAIVIECIDAERGKDALGYDAIFNEIGQAAVPSIGGIAISVIAFKAAIGGEIFLTPTILEGMALVPIEPTNEMKIAGDNAGFWCADKWRAMIAAAQGKRK